MAKVGLKPQWWTEDYCNLSFGHFTRHVPIGDQLIFRIDETGCQFDQTRSNAGTPNSVSTEGRFFECLCFRVCQPN